MQDKDEELNLFQELKKIGQESLALIAGILRLARLEMQLAKEKILIMLGLFFLLVMVGITGWLILNILFVVYLVSWGFLLTSALLMMIAINVFLGLIIIAVFEKCRRDISFSATRKQLTLKN